MTAHLAPVIIPVESPILTSSDDDDGLTHIVCVCSPDNTLCGSEIPGDNFMEGDAADDDLCVVCDDLEPMPCERCGT